VILSRNVVAKASREKRATYAGAGLCAEGCGRDAIGYRCAVCTKRNTDRAKKRRARLRQSRALVDDGLDVETMPF